MTGNEEWTCYLENKQRYPIITENQDLLSHNYAFIYTVITR